MMKKLVAVITLSVFLAITVMQNFPQTANATLIPIIIKMQQDYEKAKNEGTKSPNGHTEEKEKSSLPAQGEKGLTSKDLVRDGKVTQRRYYDSDGKADMDIDYDHSNGDGSHTFPHRHKWSWPPVGPPSRGPGY